MKFELFAVLDAKAGFFGQLFWEQRREMAIRQFSDAVNDGSNPNNMWYRHPEDFTLYALGEYDNETGRVSSLPVLEAVVTASALRAVKSPGVVKNGVDQLELPIS